jgi:uncharacterized protein YidB (DUF937 family)
MGLLDSVLGSLGGQQGAAPGGAGQSPLIAIVLSMLANNGQGGLGGLGGLAGIVAKLEQAGLGDAVASWIGTGANQSIGPDQLSQALGSDTMGQIAQQLGLSHGEAASQLSQALPQVVDTLTPQGSLPDGDLSGLSDLLGRFTP